MSVSAGCLFALKIKLEKTGKFKETFGQVKIRKGANLRHDEPSDGTMI